MGLQVLRVRRALAVRSVLPAQLEVRDFQVRAEFKVQLDSLDILVRLDYLATEEIRELREFREVKVNCSNAVVATDLYYCYPDTEISSRMLIMSPPLTYLQQVAQLSQRDRAAGLANYGQKWKSGTGRQYFTDIIQVCLYPL